MGLKLAVFPKIGDPKNYIRLFQWRGGGLPYLITDLYMQYYRSLDFLVLCDGEVWSNFLPKKVMERTMLEGARMIKNKRRFETYRIEFRKYKRECLDRLVKILRKPKLHKNDIQNAFLYFAKLWDYYSKTEFFYTDAIFKYKDDPVVRTNLLALERIKNDGREFMNQLYFGSGSYLEKFIGKLSKELEINREDLKVYSIREIVRLSDGKRVSEKDIARRKYAHIIMSKRGVLYQSWGKPARLLVSKFFKASRQKQKIVHGVTANKGRYLGRACVIHYGYKNFDIIHREIAKMEDGEVLVAESTSPELILACRKAGAIITNQGGLMSHAAIISRELDIPCIVGLGSVTEQIRNGDLTEVNANKGIVKIIK
jgi:phosphohistidine swiveling domain-containing protein